MTTRKSKTIPSTDVPGILHAYSEAQLRKALGGKGLVHPVIALEELNRRQSTGLAGVLRRQLKTSPDPTLRASFAHSLGRQNSAANRSALTKALRDESPEVVRRAAEALGRVGGETELRALRSIRPRNPVARRSVDAARVLLSYSLGASQGLLPVPDKEELLSLRNRKSRPIGIQTVTLDSLQPGYEADIAVRFRPAATAELIDCGPWQYLLLFNERAFMRGAARLRRQSCVCGMLLRSERATGSFNHYATVLSRPDTTEKIQLHVMRPNGLVLYSGAIAAENWNFTVKATNTSHAHAITLTGTVETNTPSLTVSRAQVAVEKARKQPKPRRPTRIRLDPDG